MRFRLRLSVFVAALSCALSATPSAYALLGQPAQEEEEPSLGLGALEIKEEGADRSIEDGASDSEPALPPSESQEPSSVVSATELVPSGSLEGPAGEVFISANRAYEEGRYSEAARLYEQLVLAGHDTAEVYFNLGNAHLRSGNLGYAIASYRRSKVRSPRDPETLDNLGFARKSARDALAPPEPSAVSRTLFFWHHGLSRAGLIRAGAVLSVMFWTLAIVTLYRRDELLLWAAGTLFVALLVVGASVAIKTFAPTQIAVVVPQEIDVYSGTDRASVVRFKLHAGTEVLANRESGGWIRIELPDGQQGWLEKNQVELVQLR